MRELMPSAIFVLNLIYHIQEYLVSTQDRAMEFKR